MSFPMMLYKLYLKSCIWLNLGLTEASSMLLCGGNFQLFTWFITAALAGASRRPSIFLQLCSNVHGTEGWLGLVYCTTSLLPQGWWCKGTGLAG